MRLKKKRKWKFEKKRKKRMSEALFKCPLGKRVIGRQLQVIERELSISFFGYQFSFVSFFASSTHHLYLVFFFPSFHIIHSWSHHFICFNDPPNAHFFLSFNPKKDLFVHNCFGLHIILIIIISSLIYILIIVLSLHYKLWFMYFLTKINPHFPLLPKPPMHAWTST